MKPTYHVVQMVPEEQTQNYTICALLKLEEKVELVGAVTDSGDGYNYLRAVGHKVSLWDFLFTEKMMLAETLGERVAFWYLGMDKPWKFYGTIPVKFHPDDLMPPFNYSLPCEEFYVGRAIHVLHSMEESRRSVALKKLLTFGDYTSPRELFEAGFKKQVEFYTNPEYIKVNQNCGLMSMDLSEEDLARKREALGFLEK